MTERGPIYGVQLIEILEMPLRDGGMRQAMPSRGDLEGVRNFRQGQRVVAGYEVLLNEWRRQAGIANILADEVAQHTGRTVLDELARAAAIVDDKEEEDKGDD